MPTRYYRRIDTMKKLAYTEIICTIVLVMSGILLIEVLVAKTNAWAMASLLSIFLVCVCVLIGTVQYGNSVSKQAEIYQISISGTDWNHIVNVFGGVDILPNTCVSFSTTHGFSARTLIQYCDCFNRQELANQRSKANQLINKRYGVDSSVSLFEAKTKFRINLVVCQKNSPELLAWVKHDVNKLLSRNESIVQMAIALDDNLLLVPDFTNPLMLHELNRYVVATQMVCDRLTAGPSQK